ncbi:X-ray repair cross-complementing protein 5 isoform X2 [Parasteatoda tepidariorum]|uniref:X-ray repair cross-complementing protein 5 isoform X2 n=1 Tax=Parasteatoda tepidariorum TaxID=114398 RepID=UPI0039BC6007
MAVTKEAIVIIVDVVETDEKEKQLWEIESAKSCVNMIIQRKIFSESKDEIALVLCGTKETCNKLADEGDVEFSNVEVVQEFKPANWELLEYVNKIKSSNVFVHNIKDNALLVAINLLLCSTSTKKFFSKRILFLSTFDNLFGHKANLICEQLRENKIELNLIGPVSCDDIQNGNNLQQYSHSMVRNTLKEVNGESYSFSEALPALIYYQKKKVQALPWNANLDIGTNLTIPISAYIKVNEHKQKSWKNAYARKLNAKLERDTIYLMNDEDQTKVPKDNIIPAFKYGTTLVPFTEEDKANMDYQSGEKGMKVLGFTKEENVHRYHYIGDKSMYVFGQKNRELAGVILAPFIQALHDTKMVAIVRYVYSARSAPKIGFLSPKIKINYRCLIFIALPFMEDLRHFIFSPLHSSPKNIPTDEQLSAVDDFITSMDLSTANMDDEGNLVEALKPKTTYNPYLQRLYQCLQHRSLYPEKPLPEIPPQISSIINPPEKLMKMSEPALFKIKSVFPLKETYPKKVLEKGAASFIKSESANKKRKLDDNESVGIDAVEDKVMQVGSAHPVQDFQYLLKTKMLPFGEACKQIIDIVYKYLENKGNLHRYHPKILAICKELRHASLKRKDTTQYNVFMANLREELLTCDKELWNKIRKEKIGLISNKEVKSSTFSASEAESFLSVSSLEEVKTSFPPSDAYNDDDDDYEDLLDQL